MLVAGIEDGKKAVGRACPAAVDLVRALGQGRIVVDVGCYGWLLGDATLASGVRYVGVDLVEPPERPAHASGELDESQVGTGEKD